MSNIEEMETEEAPLLVDFDKKVADVVAGG